MDVAVDVIVDVIDIVIVAVHVNGNDTVIVIPAVDDPEPPVICRDVIRE